MTKRPIHKFLLLTVYSVATYLSVSMLAGVDNSAYLYSFKQETNQQRVQQITFNRYQVGHVCKERGWEFCKKWSRYSRTRLA
ncbi:hypothetical protein [Shewanella sediminis]|uniref:hypothetical protein n=1 Tax=Shewanella sediminis TaxID=271097 RepID=UPI00059EB285|nr:hypothetical protein [Shewanella sediminis]